jgi:hypothetical protein
MHSCGKAFEYRLVFPDGRKETILSVPVYNWHWQLWYNLAEPNNPENRIPQICDLGATELG